MVDEFGNPTPLEEAAAAVGKAVGSVVKAATAALAKLGFEVTAARPDLHFVEGTLPTASLGDVVSAACPASMLPRTGAVDVLVDRAAFGMLA